MTAEPSPPRTARLVWDGKEIDFPVTEGTEGERAIDIAVVVLGALAALAGWVVVQRRVDRRVAGAARRRRTHNCHFHRHVRSPDSGLFRLRRCSLALSRAPRRTASRFG